MITDVAVVGGALNSTPTLRLTHLGIFPRFPPQISPSGRSALLPPPPIVFLTPHSLPTHDWGIQIVLFTTTQLTTLRTRVTKSIVSHAAPLRRPFLIVIGATYTGLPHLPATGALIASSAPRLPLPPPPGGSLVSCSTLPGGAWLYPPEGVLCPIKTFPSSRSDRHVNSTSYIFFLPHSLTKKQTRPHTTLPPTTTFRPPQPAKQPRLPRSNIGLPNVPRLDLRISTSSLRPRKAVFQPRFRTRNRVLILHTLGVASSH
jgi:hypothetical protein